MKSIRYLFLVCGFAFSIYSYSQSYGNFDVHSGFDQFKLGAVKSDFDSLIKPVETFGTGNVVWKGRTEYAFVYEPARIKACELAGVPFSDVVLTFDQKDSLFRISLIKAGVQRLNKDYLDSSRSQFQRLYKLLKDSWNKKGKKKVTTPGVDNKVTRYDWEDGKVVMILSLNEDKKQGVSVIQLNLEYKN